MEELSNDQGSVLIDHSALFLVSDVPERADTLDKNRLILRVGSHAVMAGNIRFVLILMHSRSYALRQVPAARAKLVRRGWLRALSQWLKGSMLAN